MPEKSSMTAALIHNLILPGFNPDPSIVFNGALD